MQASLWLQKELQWFISFMQTWRASRKFLLILPHLNPLTCIIFTQLGGDYFPWCTIKILQFLKCLKQPQLPSEPKHIRVTIHTHTQTCSQSPGSLWLCLGMWPGASWARRLPGQGGAATAGQTGRAAAGRDITAVTAAGGGVGGGSGHHKAWGTPTLRTKIKGRGEKAAVEVIDVP